MVALEEGYGARHMVEVDAGTAPGDCAGRKKVVMNAGVLTRTTTERRSTGLVRHNN